MKSAKKKESSTKQYQTFVKAASDLACDESEEAFGANLKKVATHNPSALPVRKTKAKKGA